MLMYEMWTGGVQKPPIAQQIQLGKDPAPNPAIFRREGSPRREARHRRLGCGFKSAQQPPMMSPYIRGSLWIIRNHTYKQPVSSCKGRKLIKQVFDGDQEFNIAKAMLGRTSLHSTAKELGRKRTGGHILKNSAEWCGQKSWSMFPIVSI